MTDITKRLRRRCVAAIAWGPDRGKRIIVELAPPDLIGLRPERTRRTLYLPVSTCYDLALKLEAQRRRAERAARRKGRHP